MVVKRWLKRARASLFGPSHHALLQELRGVRAEVAALRAGPNVLKTCPICLASFVSFSAFRGRANARCPQCGSFERHRLSWLYLKSETGLFRERTRFLHFAPEEVMRQRIAGNLNVAYTAASYDPEKPNEGVDIQRLPYADGSFDLTYCSHVLEHIPDDKRAIRELYRVLRSGGLAVVMVPTRNTAKTYEDPSITSPEERAKHFGRWDHLRWYGRDIVERLQAAGFDVSVHYHHEALSIDEQVRYGVAPEPIFVCRKP
jgi:SAM-dependent methyltransferase